MGVDIHTIEICSENNSKITVRVVNTEKGIRLYFHEKKKIVGNKKLSMGKEEELYGKMVVDYSLDIIESCTTGVWVSVVGDGLYITEENIRYIKEEISSIKKKRGGNEGDININASTGYQ